MNKPHVSHEVKKLLKQFNLSVDDIYKFMVEYQVVLVKYSNNHHVNHAGALCEFLETHINSPQAKFFLAFGLSWFSADVAGRLLDKLEDHHGNPR